MNTEIEKRIEVMEQELSNIKEDIKREKEKTKSKRFLPKNGEKYFFVDRSGEVSFSIYDIESLMGRFNIKTRNCFRTEEEATDYKRFMDIESRLRDLADELEENSDLYFYLNYNGEGIGSFWSHNIYPQISCKNDKFNIKALELNIPMESHESDLYLQVNEDSIKLVNEYEFKQNVTKFISQTDKKEWFDIPFAYEPFWTNVVVDDYIKNDLGIIG